MRIVSLIASATEIICALGLRDSLVGRSHECDRPDDVTALPALTTAKFDTTLPSPAIDRAVKDIVASGLSVYRVDGELLRSLAPDLIVTQDQCEVCAASLKDVEAAVCAWMDRDVAVLSLRPNCLADIWRDIAAVGAHTGTTAAADRLVRTLQARSRAVPVRAHRPRVMCVEWIAPPMAAGHWIPELVALAGGTSLLGPDGGPSIYVSVAEIAAADPDVVIVSPCGFDLARTASEMPWLAELPAWQQLRAVRNGQVYITDGNRFFNRPSPAVVETVEIIADILDAAVNPEARRRYGPDVWRRYADQGTTTVSP